MNPKEPVVRRGIKRNHQRPAPMPPLSDRQKLVLAALTDTPQSQMEIGRPLGLTSNEASMALYALANRKLAARGPDLASNRGRGWVRA